jgi:hypothetical protein
MNTACYGIYFASRLYAVCFWARYLTILLIFFTSRYIHFINFFHMQFFGFLSIGFGLIVIAFPQFLAYLIGFFFLMIGANVLIASSLFRK